MKITDPQFQDEITRALRRLPEFLKEAMRENGVAVVTETEPPADLRHPDDALFANFVGPSTAEFQSGDAPFPPTVVLYRSTFESECDSIGELREELYLTLVHELGHFLGLDEDALEDV